MGCYDRTLLRTLEIYPPKDSCCNALSAIYHIHHNNHICYNKCTHENFFYQNDILTILNMIGFREHDQ